jgi:RNA polymerase sigma factor (TIGR02999 family)
MHDSLGQFTTLMAEACAGDDGAREHLWRVVYDELRKVAHAQVLAEGRRRDLQTTVLIHEAYVRLMGGEKPTWQSRRHFFGAAAEAMRRIRVDDARSRGRLKRGAGQSPRALVDDPPAYDQDPNEVLAIDDALAGLEQNAPRQAEVVKLRYFAELTVEETADALGVSTRTVEADWRLARAWLHHALTERDE